MTTTTAPAVKHPARYSKELMPVMAEILRSYAREHQDAAGQDYVFSVLDPFAGTGRIHDVADAALWSSSGIEIEPEWAEQDSRTNLGSALDLPWPDAQFDAICTSPCYGNRLADHHQAKDGSTRRSYTHDLGRPLHEDNAGAMHWGPTYREFHRKAWGEAVRVLRWDGLFILNISDHIRAKRRQPVSAWHVRELNARGLVLHDIDVIGTRRLRFGANADARPIGEFIFTFRKDT
jgi:hypothetical protein